MLLCKKISLLTISLYKPPDRSASSEPPVSWHLSRKERMVALEAKTS